LYSAIALDNAESFHKLNTTINTLQETQKQLVQSEKMASLGELTAGIAHEIQNPLNFVNNFSEVSNELIEEIEEERAKSPESRDETLVSEILGDIKQNLIKIKHHGKRADSIVKGMLQHSRTSSGEAILTDINTLADEFLRLSYHGLRAKDKTFNADFKMDFDPDLPKIHVVSQDMGRVFLNIINNAFYAVDKKSKSGIPDYKPAVVVQTKKLDKVVEITISDNGSGIPTDIKDKIFQPFFTTKPTGQGTGLGLSLSYDIVKAHGGELIVESKVGEDQSEEQGGTSFIITLPLA
jgi:signal transduction histidine kinase